MPVVYQAKFHYTQKKEKEVLALTRTLPDGTQDTTPVNLDVIHQLEDQTRDFKWNKSPDFSRQIGERLFTILEAAPQSKIGRKGGVFGALNQKIRKIFDAKINCETVSLNGDRQTLLRALKEADEYGETLQLIIEAEGPASNLPFELLYHTDFLVPSQIHLIRRVSNRGSKKKA